MGKLCMCHLSVDPDSMEIVITDLQRIQKVPEPVLKIAYKYLNGKRILPKSGLPAVQYIGENRVQVIGAFTYGEVSFIEIEGKWTEIIRQTEEGSLLCLKPYLEPKKSKNKEESMESLEHEANSEE